MLQGWIYDAHARENGKSGGERKRIKQVGSFKKGMTYEDS